MSKEQKYNWNKLKKEFEDRLEKATPEDLKDFTGLIDSKGFCDLCKQKKVLFLNRKTKKLLCLDCSPVVAYEFTAIEFNNMWELAQEILFYADEAIKELQEDSEIKIIIPDEMWETDMGKKVIEDSDKIIKAIEEHQKKKCTDCIHCSTPKGKTCYTTVRRLKELVRDAGKPFSPTYVIPALDQIAKECKRYKHACENEYRSNRPRTPPAGFVRGITLRMGA